MSKIYFLFVLFTINNIFITITNFEGKIIFWKSLGKFKIKGLKKLTPSSIITLTKSLLFFFNNKKINLHIKLKGSNKFKKNLIKFLFTLEHFNILSLDDNNLHPSNGCKLKKYRRL